jgi:ribosomal protein S18 acetylase RimI-like enzyme
VTGEIEYRTNVDGIGAESLAGFFVGWPSPPSAEHHLELLRSSAHAVVALDGGRVIGFVTAVSDGVMSAYIPLLEVLPEYQGSGIGSELVRRVLAPVGDLYMVDLACDQELVPFYERLGFMRVGAAMGIRNRDALRR